MLSIDLPTLTARTHNQQQQLQLQLEELVVATQLQHQLLTGVNQHADKHQPPQEYKTNGSNNEIKSNSNSNAYNINVNNNNEDAETEHQWRDAMGTKFKALEVAPFWFTHSLLSSPLTLRLLPFSQTQGQIRTSISASGSHENILCNRVGARAIVL